jgi:hypothetical protein
MRTCCFGTFYLGGRIDLLRLREHLAGDYPDATLVTERGQAVLFVPLAAGVLAPATDRERIAYDVVNYQFDSGLGQILFRFRSEHRIPELEESPAKFALRQSEIAGAGLAYLRRALNIQNLSEVDSLAASPEQSRKLRSETGIQPFRVGLDAMSVTFSFADRVWLVGADVPDLETSRAEDLSEVSPGFVFGLGPDRFWSPVVTEDVTWDMVLLQLRESGVRMMKDVGRAWLEVIQRQLEQMTTTLAERNAVVWAQEREDVEQLDVNFHLLATDTRRFISTYSLLRLEVVSRERWERFSTFERHVELANKALDEAHRAIERMTRPLDFREFQLLKTGVEEVEGRIMLLTILLVLMELFRMATEPGHWGSKGVLLGLVILIPTGFLLFERWRRSAVVRRGRALLTRNRIERVKTDIKEIEQEIEQLKSEDFLAEETQQSFLSELSVSRDRLKRQQAEHEEELKKT